MMLRKTTIIPTDDKDLAIRLLKQLIFEEAHVLMIVLGTDDLAEHTVERADKLTGATDEPRWVAWVRDPALVSDILDDLTFSGAKPKNLKNAIACSLSLADRVSDVVPRTPEPDMFRLMKAFKAAEEDRDA